MTHLKPRSATIPLYQGDDMDRLAQLKRAADIAERVAESNAGTERYGDDDSAVETARREFDEFVSEAAERAVSVELRSIGREYFRDLVAAHPPRMVPRKIAQERKLGETETPPAVDGPELVEHEEDAGWGVNTETFPAALLTFRKMDDEGDEAEWVVTIAQPEFTSEAKVKRFVNRDLAEGDFDQLWQTAFLLNRSPSQDPKAARFTNGFPSTDET